MEMKLASFKEDVENGIDGWIGSLPFAHRVRNISLSKYGEVSIRYSLPSGYDTEYHKLLNGQFKAKLYVFEFTDAYIFCCADELSRCLNNKMFTVQRNPDGSEGCYIKLGILKNYLKADKEGGNSNSKRTSW